MIKEALTKYVSAIEKIWEHDRTATVGASEIGRCARQTYYMKKSKWQPAKGEPKGWGARTRGTVMEDAFWYPAMRGMYGDRLKMAGPEQKSLVMPPLSSTPDGLITQLPRNALEHLGVKDIKSDCILVECKTIDPRVNLREARLENTFQVQVQLGVVRAMTAWKPEYAVISYTDASFWDEVKEFPVKFDPKVFGSAKLRATKILTAEHPAELQPEGWIAGGDDCEYCPFTKECGVTRRSVPQVEAAADPQFAAEVTDMCRDAIVTKDQAEALEALLKEKQQAIKDRMREKSVRKVPGVVVWSSVKGRVSYDYKGITEAAERAGVDIEEFSTVGEPTDRLQILLASAGGNVESEDGKGKVKQEAGSRKRSSKAGERSRKR